MKNKALYTLLLMVPLFSFSQTKEERAKIASFSNKQANNVLAQKLNNEEQQRLARLNSYLQNNPTVKIITVKEDGGSKELMDVLPNGEFIYAETTNAGAALTARANSLYGGGALGVNVQGQGMIAGVWDEGSVRDTHQEFMVNGASKITIWDGSVMSNHATHVAGTIAAQGILASVRGLAFNSSIYSYNWTTDLTEMLNEASTGLIVSNHSYGFGQLSALWFYGAYDSRAKDIDQITYSNPFYLPVISAGNDRNAVTAPGSTQIANKGGYDMIFGHANAKNALTVAAVNEVPEYVDESNVIMSSFSSWGPSDDGRIKPEISMKGVGVRSTVSSSDTATGIQSGTSMASPGVTGVVTLLQQYHNQLYGNFMKAATVKGLVLHTADETGYDLGPDYSFGWGLINADKAAKLIRDKNLPLNKSIIEERTLAQGSTFSKSVTANGVGKLQVSISWTDPASQNNNTGTTDPSTVYLINDLDVSVTDQNGTVYYPWKLQGMSSPSSPATNNSTNNVDNYERIDIPNPVGTYTISVSHKGGTLVNANQNYTLIVSSPNLATLSTSNIANAESAVEIYPNPVTENIFIKNYVKGSRVTIVDMTGKIVLKSTGDSDKISVAHLPVGAYLLVYVGKDGVEMSSKFIKK